MDPHSGKLKIAAVKYNRNSKSYDSNSSPTNSRPNQANQVETQSNQVLYITFSRNFSDQILDSDLQLGLQPDQVQGKKRSIGGGGGGGGGGVKIGWENIFDACPHA